MVFCRVLVETHQSATTIYIAGLLAEFAAERTEETVEELPRSTRVIRLDLRAVDLIDPAGFVRVAGALNRWRDSRGGRLTIEFPVRSQRKRPALQLVDHRTIMGSAVSTAISSPISTSPG